MGKIFYTGDSHSYKNKVKKEKNIYHPLFGEHFFVSFFMALIKKEIVTQCVA